MSKDLGKLKNKAANIKSRKYLVLKNENESLNKEALDVINRYSDEFAKLGIKVYVKESLKNH